MILASNDWHIKPDNIAEIIDLNKQKIKYAIENEIQVCACLGDVFQSRQAQTQATLGAFEQILDLYHEAGLKLYVIAGNHDKTDYNSTNSFLSVFKHHPAILLMEEAFSVGENVHFIPFFNEKVWLEQFKKLKISDCDILFSHIAVEGSVNNDGSKVESNIKPSMFEGLKALFLGHYHNFHQVGENIFHLPSLQANNFGENNNKGFTHIDVDGSFKIIKTDFKEYHTIKVDLEKVTKKELNELKKEHSDSPHNIRFKLIGSEAKIKAISKDEFTSLGIDIETEQTDAEYAENSQIKVEKMKTSNIMDEFKTWCEENDKDYSKREKYIKKHLKL